MAAFTFTEIIQRSQIIRKLKIWRGVHPEFCFQTYSQLYQRLCALSIPWSYSYVYTSSSLSKSFIATKNKNMYRYRKKVFLFEQKPALSLIEYKKLYRNSSLGKVFLGFVFVCVFKDTFHKDLIYSIMCLALSLLIVHYEECNVIIFKRIQNLCET